LSAAACGGSTFYAYRPIIGDPIPPKPADCALHVVSSWAYPGYVEIGEVVFQGAVFGTRSLEEFYGNVREDVCEAGGDVVVAHFNGGGWIYRATVLKQSPIR
jgi:hypothetical protein